MRNHTLRMLAQAVMLSTVFSLLQACSPAGYNPQQISDVNEAYETSGIVAVQPYTRSIFSTHNF